MTSVSPVLTNNEIEAEKVIALDQPGYFPIISLRVTFDDETKATYTRFRFTEEERKLIANGADILISQPHHHGLMPIGLQLAMPCEYP